MSVTKEMLLEAERLFTNVQADVFFKKLAALGVEPKSEKEAQSLWAIGDRVLKAQPRASDSGRATKQACLDSFGKLASMVGQDGCSLDAQRITEELFKDQKIVKAAQLLLSANNIVV